MLDKDTDNEPDKDILPSAPLSLGKETDLYFPLKQPLAPSLELSDTPPPVFSDETFAPYVASSAPSSRGLPGGSGAAPAAPLLPCSAALGVSPPCFSRGCSSSVRGLAGPQQQQQRQQSQPGRARLTAGRDTRAPAFSLQGFAAQSANVFSKNFFNS